MQALATPAPFNPPLAWTPPPPHTHTHPQLDDLQAELSAKLAQMQVLAAENEVLLAREAVLHSSIAAANDRELQALQEEAAAAAAADFGAGATGPALRAGSATSNTSSSVRQPSCSGGGGSGAAPAAGSPCGNEGAGSCEDASDAGGGEEAASGWVPPPRTPAIEDFVTRYQLYIGDVLGNRMAPDGTVAPAPDGDARVGEAGYLVHAAMTMPAEDSFRLQCMNMETGQEGVELPPGLLESVARKLVLT
jgi:hypothetical protein